MRAPTPGRRLAHAISEGVTSGEHKARAANTENARTRPRRRAECARRQRSRGACRRTDGRVGDELSYFFAGGGTLGERLEEKKRFPNGKKSLKIV